MTDFSSIRSIFLQNSKVSNLKIIFKFSFNVQKVDYNLFNKYVIYQVNQYKAMNIEHYSLYKFIQIDFVKFEVKYFDKLDNITLRAVRDYYYLHKFWIDYNLGLNKIRNVVILEAVIAVLNNK